MKWNKYQVMSPEENHLALPSSPGSSSVLGRRARGRPEINEPTEAEGAARVGTGLIPKLRSPLLEDSALSVVSASRDFRTPLPMRLGLFYLLLLSLLILFYRNPDALLRPQFFAEDGNLFFIQAWELASHSLLEPYNGSLYLVQRLSAYFLSFLPVRYAPHAYTYLAVTLTLMSVAYIAKSRINTGFKPLLALALVASPNANEVFMHLYNVHWVLSLVLLVLCVSDDATTKWQSLFESIIFGLLCLTGPAVLLFFPLLAFRLWSKRTLYSVHLFTIALLCIGLQWYCLSIEPDALARIANRSTGSFKPFDPNWFGAWGNGLSGILLLGIKYPRFIPNCVWLGGVTALIYVALGAHACWSKDRLRLSFLAAGLGVILATTYAFRGNPGALSENIGIRYSYIPAVTVIWALILTLANAGMAARIAAGFLVLVGLASAAQLQSDPLPNYDWHKTSRVIGGPYPSKIPINPAGWFIPYQPKTDEFTFEPAAPIVAETNQITWLNGTAIGTGNDPFIVYALPKPTFVHGVRVTFTLASHDHGQAVFQAFWKQDGVNEFCETERIDTVYLPWHPNSRTLTIWVNDTIDRFRIDPDVKPCDFRLLALELLLPPANK